MRNRELDAGLFGFEHGSSSEHVGVGNGRFQAVLVKQVFAVEQVLCVLLKGNGHDLAVGLDQHVVFNFVLGLVFGHQVGQGLQLAFGHEARVHTTGHHSGVDRGFALGCESALGFKPGFWRDFNGDLDAAFAAFFHFFGHVQHGRGHVAGDIDIALATSDGAVLCHHWYEKRRR